MLEKSLISVFMCLLLFTGCAGFLPETTYKVEVSRERYTPLLEKSQFPDYAGKTLILDNVEVEAPRVTNFNYFSEDKAIGYYCMYSATSMQQPVASYFWYVLEKNLSSLGLTVTAEAPLKNASQLNLKITSLQDDRVVFRTTLSRNGVMLVQKEITVLQQLPPSQRSANLKNGSTLFSTAWANRF